MRYVLISCILFSGCGTTGVGQSSSSTQSVPDKLSLLLPVAPPAGFSPAVDVTPRSTADIFEQINGGSFSFLENGMTDALFATYPLTGGEEGTEIAFEVYRFKTHAGAKVQFQNLHGEDGAAWEGAHAVLHEYGVELVSGCLLVRVTFNDGPEKQMGRAARYLARNVLSQAHLD